MLEAGRTTALPARLLQGFAVEACEQDLVNGRPHSALAGFSRIVDPSAGQLEPQVRSQLLQRRAAAAIACQRFSQAAADLLHASRIIFGGGRDADAEACALAAAGVLAEHDVAAAERIMTEVSARAPADGAAATRRGMVGGRVAMAAGNAALALKRFDQARQGALDVGDPISYLAAAVEASRAAEAIGELKTAYARLATAWASIADVLGREEAVRMVGPELANLRHRLGAQRFATVKQDHENERVRARDHDET